MSQDNRARLRQLMDDFNIKQKRAAELIAAASRRPCSDRAIRSWLNDPESPHSRTCPDWAIENLEYAIAAMHRLLERRQADLAGASAE